MKKIRKLLAFALTLILLVGSIAFPAQAVQVTSASKAGIITALQCLAGTDLAALDFASLAIGGPIQTYIYKNNTFEESRVYYPLLKNGELVLLAIPQDGWYQITTELVKELNTATARNLRFAIIYDQECCYLYSDGAFTLMTKSSVADTSRSMLLPQKLILGANIKTASFVNNEPLGYSEEAAAVTPRTDYIECSGLSYVTQNPYTKLCWAASCISIFNYKTSYSYGVQELAIDYLGSNYNETIPVGREVAVLREYGNLTYSYRYSTIPIPSVLRQNIQTRNPIYAHFSVDSSDYHAVVIKGTGMNGSNPYIYIIDPEFGYTNAQISGGRYTYISARSNHTLRMASASCCTWGDQ